MKLFFYVLSLLASLPAMGQNVLIIKQELSFTDLVGTEPLLVQLPVDASLFSLSQRQHNDFTLRVLLKNVPDTLAAGIKLNNTTFLSSDPFGVKTPQLLKFEIDFRPDVEFIKKDGVLEWQIDWSGANLRPLRLQLPLIKTGFSATDAGAIQVDFCPDSEKPITNPNGDTWAYVLPKDQVRMVVKHINPLRYNVTLESSGVAFNTDPGAALSAVSGILNPGGNLFKQNSFIESNKARKEISVIKRLNELASIASSIAQRLNSIKRLECLDEATIGQLIKDQKEYNERLEGIPDETSLKAKLLGLASIVASLTTSAVSTTSSVASTTTSSFSTTSTSKSTETNTSVPKLKPPKKKSGSTNTSTPTSGPTSITTTVSSLTTSKASSFSASSDADIIDPDKQYLRALADYAKDDQLAHRTFEQLDKLDEVIDGTTIRLRPVSPDNYPSADVIRLTLTTTPRSNTAATPTKQTFDVLVVGRFKVDFSAGLMLTGLADQSFSSTDTTFRRIKVNANKGDTTDVTTSIKGVDQSDRVSLALATMAHFYYRLPYYKGGLNIGATIGGGITQKGRPILLAGASILLGRAQRWVINVGCVIGSRKELSARYDKPINYINSPSAEFATVDRIRASWFVGISFNWGKNERVVSPDGVTK